MTKQQLKHLRELAEAATPGPWFKGTWTGRCFDDHKHGRSCNYLYKKDLEPACVSIEHTQNMQLIGYTDYGTMLNDSNAEFIAGSNPAVMLALLDRIQELEADNEALFRWAFCGEDL